MSDTHNINIDQLLNDYFSENLNLRGKAFNEIKGLEVESNIAELFNKLEPYYTSHNLSSRNLAFDIYIYFKEFSVSYLSNYLNHKDKDVRKVTIELLITLDAKNLVDKIISLIDDEDENVRYSAIEATGKLGNYNSIPVLFEKFNTLPEYRCIILSAIGEIGGENSEDLIFEVLRSSDDIFLKMCAIDAISKAGTTEEVLYYLVEDIQNAEEELMPLYLKAIYNVAQKLGFDFTIPDPIRHIVYNSLMQNDEDYLLSSLKLIQGDIRKQDLEYFNSKFLISNSNIRLQIINNLCKIENKDIYIEFLNKLSENIIELYSFEEFVLEILNKLKEFEVKRENEILDRNLNYLIDFVLDNQNLNYILILESISNVFEIKTKEVINNIKKSRQ